MKKLLLLSSFTIILVNQAFGQANSTKELALKNQIIALDIAAWDAWKNKDVAYFQANTTPTFQSGGAYGFSRKEEMISTAFVDCNVNSFALKDIGFIQIDKKTVMLTYTATQDAECGGVQLPAKVRASVTYVKQSGKWLEAFYMDAPFME